MMVSFPPTRLERVPECEKQARPEDAAQELVPQPEHEAGGAGQRRRPVLRLDRVEARSRLGRVERVGQAGELNSCEEMARDIDVRFRWAATVFVSLPPIWVLLLKKNIQNHLA